MSAVFLIICIASQSLQSVFRKKLNFRCDKSEFSVSMMTSLFALAYFIIFSKGYTFNMCLLPYCIFFALCYAAATITCVLALRCGSLIFTDLVIVYSTVIPLGYSLVFLNEPMDIIQIIGVITLGASFLFTYYPKGENVKTQKITMKWVVYALLLFISNGMCGVIQRMQQQEFDGIYDNSFMITSLAIVFLIFLTSAVIYERKKVFLTVKNGWTLCGLCGVCNGAMNYFGLLCLMVIPGAVYYPLISAGSLVLTYFLSRIIFKEKFSISQNIGVVLGIISMIFINIK